MLDIWGILFSECVCRKLCVRLGHLLKWPESGKICRTFWISCFGLDSRHSSENFIQLRHHGETVAGWKKVVSTASLLPESTLDLGVVFCDFPSIFCPDLMASRGVINVCFLRSCVEGGCHFSGLHLKQCVNLVMHFAPTLGPWDAVALMRQIIIWQDVGLGKHLKLPLTIFILQGLPMSRTPDTLAAKTLAEQNPLEFLNNTWPPNRTKITTAMYNNTHQKDSCPASPALEAEAAEAAGTGIRSLPWSCKSNDHQSIDVQNKHSVTSCLHKVIFCGHKKHITIQRASCPAW